MLYTVVVSSIVKGFVVSVSKHEFEDETKAEIFCNLMNSIGFTAKMVR